MPADRARQLDAELLPVLARLDGTDARCAGIIAQARDDAEQIVAAARAEAAALLSEAGQRAAAARADAVRHAPRWRRRGLTPPAPWRAHASRHGRSPN